MIAGMEMLVENILKEKYMHNFDKNYENFKFRKPVPRFGGHDYTGIRFIDTATKEEILAEYALIKNKTSKLRANERNIILKLVENA